MDAAPLLRDLQQRFMAALYDAAAPGPVAAIAGNGLTAAGRLNIYRSMTNESQTAALRVTYPAVRALVGDAFFDQTARGYRRTYPSRSGNLQAFGASLGDYLATLPACDAYPYLPDVARLEWLRQETILARDAPAVEPDGFIERIAAATAPVHITLHPSVHVVQSAHPIFRIWRYALHPSPDPLTLDDDAEGERVALWREDGEVAMGAVDAATFACIVALQRGSSVDAAQAATIALDANFDFSECVGTLLEHGVIAGCDVVTSEQDDLQQ